MQVMGITFQKYYVETNTQISIFCKKYKFVFVRIQII